MIRSKIHHKTIEVKVAITVSFKRRLFKDKINSALLTCEYLSKMSRLTWEYLSNMSRLTMMMERGSDVITVS